MEKLKTIKSFLACGCQVYEQDGKNLITYCPLHKSAPTLYEACKVTSQLLKALLKQYDELARDFGVQMVDTTLDEAIAKVEDK